MEKKYLDYALFAFLILGFEMVIIMVEEGMLWGIIPSSLQSYQSIIHHIIVSLIWFTGGFFLLKKSPVLENKEKKNWIVAFVVFCLSIILSFISWNGFKVIQEFTSLGIMNFIFQYIYYAAESLLILTIVHFGQLALQNKKKMPKLFPWGGIFLALTWGLIHILSKGSIEAGLMSALAAILYGIAYLAMRQDLKSSYLLIMLMFML